MCLNERRKCFLSFCCKGCLGHDRQSRCNARLRSQAATVLQAVPTALSRAAARKMLQSPKTHTEIFYVPFPLQNAKGISRCNCAVLECAYVSTGLDL